MREKLFFTKAPEETVIKSAFKVFLAGGISGCFDWQTILTEKLMNYYSQKDFKKNLQFFNPRRENFDINNPHDSEIQINWEFNRLKISNFIPFWFTSGSLNPITLYELGMWSNSRRKKTIIGIDEEYLRKFDVILQTKLARDDVKICENFEDFFNEITKIINSEIKI